MTATTVHVNTVAHAVTHVATNMLRSLRQLVRECGLNTSWMNDNWAVLENGVAVWLSSRHLRGLVLEVWDPSRPTALVGRFDFTLDYGYYPEGDGELWLDPDTVSYTVRKNGSYPASCLYRIVADTAPGYPPVDGWSDTTLRSTAGFVRRTVGTAVGGGNLGANLAYYTRSTT